MKNKTIYVLDSDSHFDFQETLQDKINKGYKILHLNTFADTTKEDTTVFTAILQKEVE